MMTIADQVIEIERPAIQEPQHDQLRQAKAINIGELLAMDIPPRQPLLEPIITKQSLVMIYAWRGIGKSWLALFIAYAVATASAFLRWNAPEPARVLYIDGELPAPVLQTRLTMIVKSFGKEPPSADYFQILTPDMQPDGIMPNLSDPIGQAAIDVHARNADLIIVDNLSTMARSGKENEGESWLPVQQWALQHRAQGRAVLFVHHSGKGGQQRGSSRREDVLDTVISLKRPPDYDAKQGAAFELHFEKARNLTGDDAESLEVEMQPIGDAIKWVWRTAETSILDRIENLIEEGATRKDIEDETGLSRFQLKRVVDRANSERMKKIRLPDARKKSGGDE
jgi:hypothetical protein